MIKINQIKIPVSAFREQTGARTYRFSAEELRMVKDTVCRKFRLPEKELLTCSILRKSIDARKRQEASYVYTVSVAVKNEKALLKKDRKHQMERYAPQRYHCEITGTDRLAHRPVIIGSGPAGLFCGLFLARKGFSPIIFERGMDVRMRMEAVRGFWDGSKTLDLNTNVQFGEGGAGTFSDGKLNTAINESGRIQKVLETFVEYGAPEEILYEKNPHIGTDRLTGIVEQMREDIIRCGGEVHFGAKVTDIDIRDGRIYGVEVGGESWQPCEAVVLAIGHSARDTFRMLYRRQVPMQQKAFAVGIRIQHPQEMIDRQQWGELAPLLPAASYKLTYQCSAADDRMVRTAAVGGNASSGNAVGSTVCTGGRGVYSFCMCPGGYVVNASSQEGRLVVNGMSNYLRDSDNANSALIVTVTPQDFEGSSVLAGMHFQEQLEQKAFQCANGAVPIQLWEDFLADRTSTGLGGVSPAVKGKWAFANLREALPEVICDALIEAMPDFEKRIPGFSRGDALLSGVESRTSSPVRIVRDENMQSLVRGLYPCGEGAGYAGGITSAAVDGIKAYEQIIKTWKGTL